eukprot:3018382-Lingulodinium_polyedra.AAC.1
MRKAILRRARRQAGRRRSRRGAESTSWTRGALCVVGKAGSSPRGGDRAGRGGIPGSVDRFRVRGRRSVR